MYLDENLQKMREPVAFHLDGLKSATHPCIRFGRGRRLILPLPDQLKDKRKKNPLQYSQPPNTMNRP